MERAALFADTAVVTADEPGLAARRTTPVPGLRRPGRGRWHGRDEAMRQRAPGGAGGDGVEHLARRGPAGDRAQHRRMRDWRSTACARITRATAARRRPTGPRRLSPAPRHRRRRASMGAARVSPAARRPRQAGRPRRLVTASRALDGVIAKVQSFGGRVEELTPTGLVAAFGLEPAEDAPRRAAHAAMAIQKRGGAGARDQRRSARGQDRPARGVTCWSGASGPRIEIDAEAKRAQWPVLEQLLQAAGAGRDGRECEPRRHSWSAGSSSCRSMGGERTGRQSIA